MRGRVNVWIFCGQYDQPLYVSSTVGLVLIVHDDKIQRYKMHNVQ